MTKKEYEKEFSGIVQLCKSEREVIEGFTEADDSVLVYTCNFKVMKMLDDLCAQFPDIYVRIQSDRYGCKYTYPVSLYGFKKPRKLSEEQRRKKADIMRQNRQKKSPSNKEAI